MSIIDIMKTVDMLNFRIFSLLLLLCSHCLSPAATAAVLELNNLKWSLDLKLIDGSGVFILRCTVGESC